MEPAGAAERELGPPRVAAAGSRALVLAGARLVLSLLLLVAALLAGARTGRALGGFALGAAFLAFAARIDRRALLLGRDRAAVPMPPEARPDRWWRVAAEGMLPSTAGLSVMAIVALATGNLLLGAILAGSVAGLGIAAALAWVEIAALESREHARFFVEVGRGRRVFAVPTRGKPSSTA